MLLNFGLWKYGVFMKKSDIIYGSLLIFNINEINNIASIMTIYYSQKTFLEVKYLIAEKQQTQSDCKMPLELG